jgi:GTP cyclohydrolase II
MQIVREHHRDREAPLVSVQDEKATFELFQEAFCRVDWRLFDPATASWRFDGDGYVERLKGLRPSAA